MDLNRLEGKAEMRISDMFMLIEKAKFYEEAYGKVEKCLQTALQEMVMSLGRTVKANDPNARVRVDGDSMSQVIEDITKNDKVLHIYLKLEEVKEDLVTPRQDIVVIIKTGFKENDKIQG